nr:MAG TPA: hypothetical protein [Crassvirales sp.]
MEEIEIQHLISLTREAFLCKCAVSLKLWRLNNYIKKEMPENKEIAELMEDLEDAYLEMSKVQGAMMDIIEEEHEDCWYDEEEDNN